MFTQTDTTFVVVTQEADDVMKLGMKRHWSFWLIPDFRGVIDIPVFSKTGTWLYAPLMDEDKKIIPKAAYRRHAAITKAGFRVAQVIIGHEVKPTPEEPEEAFPRISSTPEVDWSNVAEVAGKGILLGMAGIAVASISALIGALRLVDPSYCIVLDDGPGTVIELIRFNTEVKNGKYPLAR